MLFCFVVGYVKEGFNFRLVLEKGFAFANRCYVCQECERPCITSSSLGKDRTIVEVASLSPFGVL